MPYNLEIMNGEKYLNEFYLKILLIKGSANTVNIDWGSDILFSFDRHVFTDPFSVAITSDPRQVSFFNKIFGTSDEEIIWKKFIDSKQTILINKDNKEEILRGYIQQNYNMLSVSLFENLIVLLKNLLLLSFGDEVFKGYNKNSAKCIITIFKEKYSCEIENIDEKTVYDMSFISNLHCLRLLRNCIVHHNSELEGIESEFVKDKEKLNLKRNLLCYQETNGHLYLEYASFQNIIDLYSQFAYIAYVSYRDQI